MFDQISNIYYIFLALSAYALIITIVAIVFIVMQKNKIKSLITEIDKSYLPELDRLNEEILTYENKINLLNQTEKNNLVEIATLTSERNNLAQKLQEQESRFIEEQRKNNFYLESNFQKLVNNLLSQSTITLEKQSAQLLSNIVAPLNTNIINFKKEVSDNKNITIEQNTRLATKIDSLNTAQLKLSDEANKLTKALTGNSKVVGNWGEIILERVLEEAGLKEHVVFEREVVLSNDSNQIYRPDAIINLPNDKQLIIDSKCSLNAYSRYINAVDPETQALELKEHIKNIEARIDELSKKDYHTLKGINAPNFVFMFIPIEYAFIAAFNEKPELITKASNKHVSITTPSTLLSALFIVKELFALDARNKNLDETIKIISGYAKKLNELNNKFIGVEKAIEGAADKIKETRNYMDAPQGVWTQTQKITEKLKISI